MPLLDMHGPVNFDADSIAAKVETDHIGNYALGYIDDEGVFIVMYVGRSDEDLVVRLKQQFNENGNRYPKFKFSYADTIMEAFEKECRNYHEFDPPDNKYHPKRPEDYDGLCPVSGCDRLD